MNTITVPVSLADDPFAENAGRPLPTEVTITIPTALKVSLESADTSVASRAFDDLEEIIKSHLDSIGLGGIGFSFG